MYRKSLRAVNGKTADWAELAKDCVAFANALGGAMVDWHLDNDLPPPGQRVVVDLPDTLRRRLAELTVNVSVRPRVQVADNGGEFIELAVERATAVALTSDGRFYLRIGDASKPVLGDEVMRLAGERSALPWETLTTLGVPRAQADPAKRVALLAGLRASDRVKASVKEKSDEELLNHQPAGSGRVAHSPRRAVYRPADRPGAAGYGAGDPVHQARCAGEQGLQAGVGRPYAVADECWFDAVWRDVPDFREFYEVADGLFCMQAAAFDERVIRELLINALVHRPYTQRGDIYLNLHPDRLEIVNPGPLPRA